MDSKIASFWFHRCCHEIWVLVIILRCGIFPSIWRVAAGFSGRERLAPESGPRLTVMCQFYSRGSVSLRLSCLRGQKDFPSIDVMLLNGLVQAPEVRNIRLCSSVNCCVNYLFRRPSRHGSSQFSCLKPVCDASRLYPPPLFPLTAVSKATNNVCNI